MAATSTPPPLFLAHTRSIPALFQCLRDGGHIAVDKNRAHDGNFVVKHSGKDVPNPAFVASDVYAQAVVHKRATTAEPIATRAKFEPMCEDFVEIEFETLVLMWYMINCAETLNEVTDAINFLKLNAVDVAHIDALEEFALSKKSPEETMPLTIRDLFSMLLNAFFIARRPSRVVNMLFVRADSPIIGEYAELKNEELLSEGRCFAHGGNKYVMTLYGAFCAEYIQSFMAHYGNIWSINRDRYV